MEKYERAMLEIIEVENDDVINGSNPWEVTDLS